MATVESVRRLLSAGSPASASAGFTGFTTYLKHTLMNNVAYVSPVQRRSGSSRKRVSRGLVLGRRLDAAFRTYATGGSSPPLTGAVASVLRRRGIRLVCSQTRVHLAHLRVRTFVDGIGVDGHGCVWVLELKNTQQTVAEHRSSYHLPCPNNRLLSNGMANTECVRHSLQAGFGVVGLVAMHPSLRVRGLVIVNCADGACGYPTDGDVYAQRSAFPASHHGPRVGGRWDDRDEAIKKLVSTLGFTDATLRRTSSGRIGVYRRPNGSRLAIVVGAAARPTLEAVRADVRAVVVVRRGKLAAEVV